MQHVGMNPEAYANPLPVAHVLDAVPSMPPGYDEGALLDELVKLKIFVVEHRDFTAMLVPAESAAIPKAQKKAASVTVAAKVSPDSTYTSH